MNRILTSVVFLAFLLFFLFFQSTSLYGGDAGDLVSAAFTGGIAHPPGYPLYSFLGYLVSHIPLSTVAWRVGLLSSLSMAGALTILYMLMYRLAHSHAVAILTTSVLASTYLIWLYAIVPEVFGLGALFTIAIVYCAYVFSIEPTTTKLHVLAFLTGLSLTHHHIIVFTFPVVAVFLWQQRIFITKLSLKEEMMIVGFGILGLLPYIWAPIAAFRIAPIVWDDPRDLSNFIRLISRADYGSFQSGIAYGQDIRSRFLQFPAIFDFYLNDFTLLGVLLFVAGAIYMWLKKPKIFFPLILGFLITGPAYFFYASYLLTSAFHIATAERFLIPSYLFCAIFMGYGMYALLEEAGKLAHKHAPRLQPLISGGIVFVVALLPLSLAYSNYPKLSILKYDTTAEKFGRDVLASTENNSILLLQGDHPVFNTQYMYYAYGMRPDVKVIHMTKLLNGTGTRQIQKYYPELGLKKDISDSLPELMTFIKRNYKQRPIYASIPFSLIPEGYRWVSYGLLYRLYKETDIPPYPVVDARNELLWHSYQDPMSGSLGQYKNLMLSNVVDYYRDASVRRGLYGVTHGSDYQNALKYYDYALKLDPKRGSITYLKGDAYLSLGRCDDAKKTFEEAYVYRSDDKELYYESMISLYRDCYKDKKITASWQKKRADFLKKKETQLKEL